jgi:hypothetical protein
MPLLESPKLLPIFLFLFTSIVLFLYNQKREAYYTLIIIPVLNIISLVAIWGTTGIFLLVDMVKKRKINWKYWIPFAGIVFFYFIYIFQGNSRSSGGEDFHLGLLRLYITQPIVYLLAYIHIIALLFLLDKKKVWSIVKKIYPVVSIAFFLPMTVSIFMRSYNYDATQFVTGIITVIIYAIVAVIFLTTVASIQLTQKRKVILFFFCGLSLLMSMDAYKRYIRKNIWPFEYESVILKQIPSSQKEYRIGFYIGKNVTLGKGGNYVSGIVDAVTIPDVLDYYYNNVYHYSINKGDNDVQYTTDTTPFRDYYTKMKSEFPNISDDEIRINFIKENQIEYIRIFQGASPSDEFLSHLSLLAEDVITGQRFYVVNKE